MTRNIPVY